MSNTSNAQPVPDSADYIVLLDGTDPAVASANLMRFSFERGRIWTAEMPTAAPDIYVSFNVTGAGVQANSWSGYQVLIDINLGRILTSQFSK